MHYSACNVQCYCAVRAEKPYSERKKARKKSAGTAERSRSHLLLHAVEEGGVVTCFSHQLSVAAVLGDLAVPHQDHIVTLGKVL